MSFLFKIEGMAVMPNPETLLISPFKEIWERDKSKKKELAIKEFSYIEFMTSMLRSNPYREYPEDRKHKVILEAIFKEAKWKPDHLIYDAMAAIKELQEEGSLTYSFWMSAKIAAEKMKEFFIDFDINERNERTGNPIYKPADISRALKDAETNLTTLTSLKKKVDEEIFELVRTRGDKEISPFANPNSIK